MASVLRGVQPAGEVAAMPADAAPELWFDELFRDHYGRIVALLAGLTGDRAQAEEIAADVFCKISGRGRLASGGADPVAWLYRVATNAGLDALRSNTRRRRREEAAGAEALRSASR